MQKSKGVFLLKRAGLLAVVLVLSGAQRAVTPGPGGPAVVAMGLIPADADAELVFARYAGNWVLGGMDRVDAAFGSAGKDGDGRLAGAEIPAGMDGGIKARDGAVVDAVGAPVAGTDVVAEGPGWMSIEEAAGKLQKEERPVLIDLYTTWCGWCKQMDRKTYSNKQVVAYLQEKFYPVKVDAETRGVINWKGKEYHFSPNYRSNEFAVYLTRGKLEFPTTIIIPPGGEPQAIPGYMEPKELELLVKYFGEGKFNKVGFDEFQKSFRPSW